MSNKIVLIVHNVRSCYNVGSLLRTADGLGVYQVYFTGYTPYPPIKNDGRLPHIANKISRQIKKTSLGAEKSVVWKHEAEIKPLLNRLKKDNFQIAALEQISRSVNLPSFSNNRNLVLIAGNEVEGLDEEVLAEADICLEIPMSGTKESFNVAVAAAVALYHLKYHC
jgi:23S rRNA (guanosine2251-2'-O)-methyltransferase